MDPQDFDRLNCHLNLLGFPKKGISRLLNYNLELKVKNSFREFVFVFFSNT